MLIAKFVLVWLKYSFSVFEKIHTKKSFTLTDNQTGTAYDLPVMDASIGPSVIDVRKLYAETDHFTYDPGFTSTGSCESKITFIDGDKGILRHRGYSIEDLAENCSFTEVAYLLLNGELANQEQQDKFDRDITMHTMVHEQLHKFYDGFRRDAHPMAILCGVTGALSAFYHDSTDISDPAQRQIASRRLIAKMPTLAAMAFKYSMGPNPKALGWLSESVDTLPVKSPFHITSLISPTTFIEEVLVDLVHETNRSTQKM